MGKRTPKATASGSRTKKKPQRRKSSPPKLLSREDILNAPNGNDKSPDWHDWSLNKCERMRAQMPEIDEWLGQTEREIDAALQRVAEAKRRVMPDYRWGDKIDNMAIRALVAREFNLDPITVGALPCTDYDGLLKAYAQIHERVNDPFLPASCFKPKIAERCRKAAQPGRKGKRVRSKVSDGAKCYSVLDAKRWWGEDVLVAQ